MIQLTREEVQQVLEGLRSYPHTSDWDNGHSIMQSKLSEQCFCDRNNLGKPGVSCGDCPTRDYKTEKDDVEPVAYLAWRDGQPCWDEDCVCQDAVYPVDEDDDRTSMPVYLHPAPKPMTDFDIRGKLSTLKCWHRLSGDEVQDLIEFAQNQQSK